MISIRDKIELRAWAFKETRAFFHARGFVEIDTPVLVQNPGLDVHLDAFAVHDTRARLAGHLNTSPEYHMKRALAQGSGPIFQLFRAFRANEAGQVHEPEFVMLEWYRPHAGWLEVMRDTEELVTTLATLRFGQPQLPSRNEPGAWIDVTPPWPRKTIDEIFRARIGRSCFGLSDDEFFSAFVEHIDPHLQTPVMLTEWPARYASLARKIQGSHPEVAERFEAYICGVELCNGFGELTDPLEQRKRFVADQKERERLGKTVYPIDEAFMASMPQLPPSGGNALGFDRLLMLLSGAKTLQDVILFPHVDHHVEQGSA